MKRLVACALLVLAVPGSAVATHSEQADSDGPPRDFAVGGGKFAAPIIGEITVSAHSDPTGLRPSGYITRHVSGGNYRQGHVTCLRVSMDGKRATIGYRIDQSTNFPEGMGGIIYVEDNGPPGDPLTVDYAEGAQTGTIPPPTQCPSPRHPVFPLEEPTITIHNAAP